MPAGFIALGILCILYYGFLIWYTRRWNGTFTWFWAAFGILCIICGVLCRGIPVWAERVLRIFIAAGWIVFFAIELFILCAMVSVVPRKLDYLIVLGAQIRGTKVTEALKRRLDRAVRYLQENPETTVIVSGGKGSGEDITEAKAMADYLFSCGVEAERILKEEESTTTYENLKNCLALIGNEKKDKIGIVTNNFHIYRSMKIAGTLGYQKRYAVTASCNPVVFPNYMVREFFAVIALFLKLRKSNRKN